MNPRLLLMPTEGSESARGYKQNALLQYSSIAAAKSRSPALSRLQGAGSVVLGLFLRLYDSLPATKETPVLFSGRGVKRVYATLRCS